MKSNEKQYPSLRHVAERLIKIADFLQRDIYSNSKLTRTQRFCIGSDIQELRSHVLTILHWAPLVQLDENTYPRTLDDWLESFERLPF